METFTQLTRKAEESGRHSGSRSCHICWHFACSQAAANRFLTASVYGLRARMCWDAAVTDTFIFFSAVIESFLPFTRKGAASLISPAHLATDQSAVSSATGEGRSALRRGCEEDKFPATSATAVSVRVLYSSGECWGEKHEV